MDYLPYLLIVAFIFLLILNYLSFISKKTAIQLVNEMGIGYNLGNTYNCCITSEVDNIKNEQINIWGTILPTRKQINQIKKYGFKTIRFQVVYNNLITESEKFKTNWIKELKKIIDYIYNLNMYCILSIYHKDDFWNSEEIKAIDKYVSFWEEIANEFKNYDDYLIFESNHKIYFENITLINVSQSFINVIRNSGGLNEKRLLIIPKLSTELEIYRISDEFPNDPSNKTAISIHYYFPSLYGGEHIYDDDGDYYIIYEDDIVWYDYSGEMLVTTPLNDWGVEGDDYYFLYEDFQNYKRKLMDKGIPIIIGEAGILTKNGNANLFSQFLYTLFSMSYEYDGIMACLWDNSESNEENKIYYNRETNKWTNEKIKKSIQKISRGNNIRILEYYINTNIEIIIPEENYWNSDIEFKQTRILALYINARLFGKLGDNIKFGFSYYNSNNDFTYFEFKKQHSKKQYDGTTIFKIDLSNMDVNFIIQGEIYEGYDLIIINNVTAVFEGYFNIFDYNNLQKEVLKELNR